MSAAGRSNSANTGHVRPANDFFATPAWCVEKICHLIPSGSRILDPGAGSGSIGHALLEYRPDLKVSGVELFPRACRYPIVSADYLELPFKFGWNDYVIGNPPYSLAMEFVLKSFQVAPKVCMLLRLGWLEGVKRGAFHKQYPADVKVLSKRPSFTGDNKTDAAAYGWFCWGFGGGSWEVL